MNQTATSTECRKQSPAFAEVNPTAQDMMRINRFAPTPLQAEQVFIRSMYLCSNQPCDADHCQLTRNALQQIARQIPGQSVLAGHNRNTLPLARFYHAEVVQRGLDEAGQPILFVRAWFYWLRETEGSRDLLLKIDGGIYREVSLAWQFSEWRCSVCDAQRGECRHIPGKQYGETVCRRIIDSIDQVLEGSLVYKAADRGTWLAGMRAFSPPGESHPLLLIADEDDPMLGYLQARGLVRRIKDRNELEQSCRDAQRLWLRTRSIEAFDPQPIADGTLVMHDASRAVPNAGPVFYQKQSGALQRYAAAQ